MKLTRERINELAAKPSVRAIAVENFLGSLGSQSKGDALANLEQDARAYGWNARTIAAIRTGIVESFRVPRVDREWQRENAMQFGMGCGAEQLARELHDEAKDDERLVKP